MVSNATQGCSAASQLVITNLSQDGGRHGSDEGGSGDGEKDTELGSDGNGKVGAPPEKSSNVTHEACGSFEMVSSQSV